MPAISSLASDNSKLLALTLIKPPLLPATETLASLVNSTLLRSISSVKLKLPSVKLTSPAADNPPSSTNPPGAVTKPPSRLILPPIKPIVAPGATSNPTSL